MADNGTPDQVGANAGTTPGANAGTTPGAAAGSVAGTTAADIPLIRLNDGNVIPQLGLGTFQMDDETARTTVRTALELGFRHIDGAWLYENEVGVGQGIRDAIDAGTVTREDVFLTTKIWNDRHRAADTRAATEEALQRLGLDYVDLLLVHWPVPKQGLFAESYAEMLAMRGEGLTRSVGVANFYTEVLDQLPEAPAVNQIELHPAWPQDEQVADDAERGIVTQCWSPLGRAKRLGLPEIIGIAEEVGATPAQIVLRWHLQRGLVPVPKSANPERLRENLGVTGFELSDEHMAAIATLAGDTRMGPDPREFG